MARIAVSVEIDAAPERVWQVLEPIERHVDWMADAVAIRFTGEQRRGVGTSFDCDTRIGPFRVVDRMQITAWAPPLEMGVRHTGIVTGTGSFLLTPIDLGRRTRMTWSEELRFPRRLGGRIGEVVGGSLVMKTVWRRNLRALKRLVEGGR